METDSQEKPPVPRPAESWWARSFAPFRKATIRGLALVLPPLLTIVFFIWVWGVVESYVIRPVDGLLQTAVVMAVQDIRPDEAIRAEIERADANRMINQNGRKVFIANDGTPLVQIGKKWLPFEVVELVDANADTVAPTTAEEYWNRYVRLRYLKRHLVVPATIAIFISVLYLLGKFLAAGLGRFLWHQIESLINQLPIIRNVYSSVKQITDFAFNETEFQFTRVVAVEYPRRGIWSMGFVTGESFSAIHNAAGEPMLTVLMPTSPMPATGFTISVPKSETIDLNVTIDQAIQFCVSCGVVVPESHRPGPAIDARIRGTIAGQMKSAASPASQLDHPDNSARPTDSPTNPAPAPPVKPGRPPVQNGTKKATSRIRTTTDSRTHVA